MFETIIKQNTENRDVSKAGLQVNKEKYIFMFVFGPIPNACIGKTHLT